MSNKKSRAERASINRINARLSTGPRTDKGKASSRLNALRHTLCSQTVVSSNNNLVAYTGFQKRFFDDLQPKGIIEEQLTQTLTDCSWRLNCARIYETNLITLGTEEQVKTIEIEGADAEIQYALAAAKAYRSQVRALSAISIHEQRVSREFHRSLKELREIQAVRREEERHQKIEAARLYKLHKEVQQAVFERAQAAAPGEVVEPATPYDAAQDGFVLTNDEIETYIRRDDRRRAALYAESRRPATAEASA